MVSSRGRGCERSGFLGVTVRLLLFGKRQGIEWLYLYSKLYRTVVNVVANVKMFLLDTVTIFFHYQLYLTAYFRT